MYGLTEEETRELVNKWAIKRKSYAELSKEYGLNADKISRLINRYIEEEYINAN